MNHSSLLAWGKIRGSECDPPWRQFSSSRSRRPRSTRTAWRSAYAVLSLVGDQLTVVRFEIATGSRLDKNPRRLVDLPDRSLDRTMIFAVEDAIKRADPGAKVVLLCWFQLLVRWTLPRFRADQLMNLGWKLLLPLSLANIMVTALIKLIFMK